MKLWWVFTVFVKWVGETFANLIFLGNLKLILKVTILSLKDFEFKTFPSKPKSYNYASPNHKIFWKILKVTKISDGTWS